MQSVTHKRGATLSWAGALADDAGVAVDLTGYTLTAQVRDASRSLITEATVTLADQITSPGVFSVVVGASDTAAWPLATLLTDVRVVSPSGHVDYTETIRIDVKERQTEP